MSTDDRPVLVDLFCKAGGTSAGYARAGFRVIGVDVDPQPRYPFTFIRADVLDLTPADLRGLGASAIAGSPPCQAHSPLNALSPDVVYPDLIPQTRALFEATGLPYVIENVPTAPVRPDIVLCGGMFGLRTYRHRRFELGGWTMAQPAHPDHVALTATSRRRERWALGWHVSITGDVGTYVGPEAMGIDWMTGNELSEAIPPPYTDLIGRALLEHLAP